MYTGMHIHVCTCIAHLHVYSTHVSSITIGERVHGGGVFTLWRNIDQSTWWVMCTKDINVQLKLHVVV